MSQWGFVLEHRARYYAVLGCIITDPFDLRSLCEISFYVLSSFGQNLLKSFVQNLFIEIGRKVSGKVSYGLFYFLAYLCVEFMYFTYFIMTLLPETGA
jgi:hypothetical protein